ncbi:MAG: ATP-binding protein [Bacteroidales bacterium]|nr:ATP-binding protein [Bacteroidales bacterium]
MKIIRRNLQTKLKGWLFSNKVIIVFGARQVGKTTLMKEIVGENSDKSLYLNCETFSVQQSLNTTEPRQLKSILGDARLVVFDEAQRIENIGLILKIIHDTYPEIQLVATGLSSFDLSAKINEPLTGRAIELILFPFSYHEASQLYSAYEMKAQLERFLRFGMYPEILQHNDNDARLLLDNLTGKYLYKDIFEYETIRKPQVLVKLLQMLALQVGSEVSMNELAGSLKLNRNTLERYLDMLEKAFVIFRLYAFSRNLRNELTKKVKIYFYDVGIRNSLINNFNRPEIRQDVGALWENFMITERLKYNQMANRRPGMYFWRTHSGDEIDYIEEMDNVITAYEFKYQNKLHAKAPRKFKTAYPNSIYEIVHTDNFNSFILPNHQA